MALHFDKTLTTREQLRSVLGEPSPRVVAKVIDHAKLTDSVQAVQAGIDESYRDRMY